MLPYMTKIRHRIRENAMMGFELTEELEHLGEISIRDFTRPFRAISTLLRPFKI